MVLHKLCKAHKGSILHVHAAHANNAFFVSLSLDECMFSKQHYMLVVQDQQCIICQLVFISSHFACVAVMYCSYTNKQNDYIIVFDYDFLSLTILNKDFIITMNNFAFYYKNKFKTKNIYILGTHTIAHNLLYAKAERPKGLPL